MQPSPRVLPGFTVSRGKPVALPALWTAYSAGLRLERNQMRLTSYLAALLCLLALAPTSSAQQQTAVPVATMPAELRPITKSNDFVGRIEAIQRVEIRARITGFLQDVLFKEGTTVKEGDILYRIEPDTFEASVQQAQGALYEAQGRFTNATAQRGRTEELARTAAASRALLDERV